MTGHVKGRLQVKSNIQSRPSPIWPCPPLHSLKGMLSGSKDTGVLLFRSFIMLSHASVHLCCCLCVAFSPAKPAWQTPKTPSNLSSSIIFLWEAFDSSRKTRASFPLCFHWTPQLYKLGVWTLLVSKSVSKILNYDQVSKTEHISYYVYFLKITHILKLLNSFFPLGCGIGFC